MTAIPDPENYSRAQPVAAEGARIGFVHCVQCGAAVMLDMQIDSLVLHEEWHRRIEESIR
jgi:hypothetical protein